ncbi:protein lethal(2)essential for life-like [Ochlerotatus camptorhynchus]|uniref:protein lethal(2)essential for life-like n=1 Tax=Ochlerotatus camptorhynchus TaxID=644619 RepID=UPI0031E0868B
MALIPIVFRDWWGDYMGEQLRPFQLLDKYTDLFPEDILRIIDNGPKQGSKRKRSRPCSCHGDENTDRIVSKKASDAFQITVDVQQFKPEEISVKITDSGCCITVDGKHEEGEEENESSYVFRRFVRHYQLPDGIDERKLQTSFSSDGVLTISATNSTLPTPKMEQSIPITRAMGSTANES